MTTIFIGKLIQEELKTQKKSVVWLSNELGCNRTNIYKIFNRRSIDAELLLRISKALQRNFFEPYISRLPSWKQSFSAPLLRAVWLTGVTMSWHKNIRHYNHEQLFGLINHSLLIPRAQKLSLTVILQQYSIQSNTIIKSKECRPVIPARHSSSITRC